jgi:hypothetical protein
MLRTRHKSWFGVATADMFITSVVARSGHGLLLLRMRRATAIETDLLQIQAEYETGDDTGQKPQSVASRFLQRAISPSQRDPRGTVQVMLTRAGAHARSNFEC